MLHEILLAGVSLGANPLASVYGARKWSLIVSILQMLVIIGLFLERLLRKLLRQGKGLEFIVSMETAFDVRTYENVVSELRLVADWTDALDFSGPEFVVPTKVLNKMITPGEATFARVALTEGTRISRCILTERSAMAIQGVDTGKPTPTRTLEDIMLFNARMFFEYNRVREYCVTCSTCERSRT
ncbi:hypothetical protein GGR53DRAFT_484552 [Hypoxylon sp. FL1150]|nr:hypothetical protein GGR53DRAFT_484552 [Hypoxylon sp. FL1150]